MASLCLNKGNRRGYGWDTEVWSVVFALGPLFCMCAGRHTRVHTLHHTHTRTHADDERFVCVYYGGTGNPNRQPKNFRLGYR